MTFQEVERLRVGDRVVRMNGTHTGLGGVVTRLPSAGAPYVKIRWDNNPTRDKMCSLDAMIGVEREGAA